MKQILYILSFLLLFLSCKQENQNSISERKQSEKSQEEVNHNTIIDALPQNGVKKIINQDCQELLIENDLDSLYRINESVNPNFLEADFNGDGNQDIVFIVNNSFNGELGLIFFHSSKDYHIVGGGNKESALEPIYYENFRVFNGKLVYETIIDEQAGDIIGNREIQLNNTSLKLYEEEGTSGILTWDGEKYIYIHTGD